MKVGLGFPLSSLSAAGSQRFGVLVIGPGIEQAHILRADRDGQPFLDGVQADEVAEDVPLDREG